jgi:hypothetical protein
MPKYKVKMNYVIAKGTEFVVEAKDPDELHDLIGNIDSDKLETIVEWVCTDYESPIIEEYEKVNKDTPVNRNIQKAMNETKKAWEAL